MENHSNTTKTNRSKKILAALGVTALLVGGIYGAFSATVSSTGNEFASGTLTLDGGNGNGVAISPVYFKTNAIPGDSGATATSCPSIQNSGSVNVPNGSFKLYAGTLTGVPAVALTNQITVTVERGTGTLADCSDFVSGATVYTNTLTNFQTAANSYATGIDTGVGLNAGASQRFQISTVLSAAAPNNVQGLQSGVQAVTWEARS